MDTPTLTWTDYPGTGGFMAEDGDDWAYVIPREGGRWMVGVGFGDAELGSPVAFTGSLDEAKAHAAFKIAVRREHYGQG